MATPLIARFVGPTWDPSWMKMIEFPLEFHWNLFSGVQLTIRFGSGWTNPDKIHWCIHAALGGDELTGNLTTEFMFPSCIQKLIWSYIRLISEFMMTSSNGNSFHVTGLLCREFTGHRWIPHTKASDTDLWCFLWSAPEKTVEQTFVRLMIDLRHHRAHHDTTVMCHDTFKFPSWLSGKWVSD